MASAVSSSKLVNDSNGIFDFNKRFQTTNDHDILTLLRASIAPHLPNATDYKLIYGVNPINGKFAKQLQFSEKELQSDEGTVLKLMMNRVQNFAKILCKYKESTEKDQKLLFRNNGDPTVLKADKLMTLFLDIFKKEFVNKAPHKLSQGELLVVEDLNFFVKVENDVVHIVLPDFTREIGRDSCSTIVKALNVSTATFEAMHYVLAESGTKNNDANKAASMLAYSVNVRQCLHESGVNRDFESSPSVFFDFRHDSEATVLVASSGEWYAGTIADFLQQSPPTISTKLDACIQVVGAFENLWKKGFRHCNVGPEKILYYYSGNDVGIAISDFGNARTEHHEPDFLTSPCHEVSFRADADKLKHLLTNNKRDDSAVNDVEKRLEIFQLGCTLHFILAYKVGTTTLSPSLPYTLDKDRYPTVQEEFDRKRLVDMGCPEKLVDLIGRMLDKDSKKRPLPEEFLKEWNLLVSPSSKKSFTTSPTAQTDEKTAAACVTSAAASSVTTSQHPPILSNPAQTITAPVPTVAVAATVSPATSQSPPVLSGLPHSSIPYSGEPDDGSPVDFEVSPPSSTDL